MVPRLGAVRQGVQTAIGRALPPAVAVPLRSRYGGSREPELAILDQLVAPGDTVVDVGAHRGVYTYRLVGLVGRDGHVVAYEPQPEMIRYLRRAARRGRLGSVDLRERALSDSPGRATLSIPTHEGVRVVGQATLDTVDGVAESQQVQVAVFDDEQLPGRVSFIKIDVEGHELALLRGARALLQRDRPALLVEVEVRHAGTRVAELAALLLDELGYTAWELRRGRLEPVPRERWDGAGLNELPDGSYVNNFVFRPGPTPTGDAD